ncbi:unnamed protein product [Chrysoparadoxa australica]
MRKKAAIYFLALSLLTQLAASLHPSLAPFGRPQRTTAGTMEFTPESVQWTLSAVVPPLLMMAILLRSRPKKSPVPKFMEGQVVWITGGSSGVGAELALLASKNGAESIILSGRRTDALADVKKACLEILPGRDESSISLLSFDLGDASQVKAAAAKALTLYGRVDVLANNAGISTRGAAADTALDVDMKVMETNYMSPVSLSKAVLPGMLERGSGHFLVINSVQGMMGIPYRASYAASKHALTGFFDSLRAEVANSGVGVTSVYPGYIRTSLSLNALTGSGAAHGVMDPTTAQGMNPADVATKAWTAAASGEKELILADTKIKFAIILRAVLPNLFFKIMAKRALKEAP